ncbi:hypothetical protein ILYODFUR_036294 [Ilyodon furcidens]|uniref:Uncharacterized protein n=1 Tax=Ilyodon furcidens TaxID=33524 RepID=A0ABV0SS07_9TELE
MFCSCHVVFSVNQLYSVHLHLVNLSCFTWFTLHKYTPVLSFIAETFLRSCLVVQFMSPVHNAKPVLPTCPCLFLPSPPVSEFFVIKYLFTYHHTACSSAFWGPISQILTILSSASVWYCSGHCMWMQRGGRHWALWWHRASQPCTDVGFAFLFGGSW